MNIVTKSPINPSTYLRATTQVIANGSKPLASPVPVYKEVIVPQSPILLTSHSMSKLMPKNHPVSVSSGVPGIFFL